MVTGLTMFQVENARLLEKVRASGVDADDFNGWKARGRFIRKGERQKSWRVKCGTREREQPGTGEVYHEPIYKTAYGFTADQVR